MSSRRPVEKRRPPPVIADDGGREVTSGTQAKPKRLEDEESQEGKHSTAGESLQAIGTFLAPGTLIGALLYYFGWVRTHSFYAYFGVDADDLGLSTTDYFLRSAGALWPPLIVVVVSILVAQLGKLLASRHIDRVHEPRRLLLVLVFPLCLCGVGLVAFGAFRGFLSSSPVTLTVPVSLAGGFAILASAWHFFDLVLRKLTKREPKKRPSTTTLVASGTFLALVALTLFWATALFADSLGRGRAQHLESAHFDTVPDVLLYSTERIHVDFSGVEEQDLGPDYSPYRFRYSGLKLLVHSDRKFVLIPYSWATTNAFALVLPDDKDVRIVFAPVF